MGLLAIAALAILAAVLAASGAGLVVCSLLGLGCGGARLLIR